MTYERCKKLIQNGSYEQEDMLKKLDVFLLADRITTEQYNELTGIMQKKEQILLYGRETWLG